MAFENLPHLQFGRFVVGICIHRERTHDRKQIVCCFSFRLAVCDCAWMLNGMVSPFRHRTVILVYVIWMDGSVMHAYAHFIVWYALQKIPTLRSASAYPFDGWILNAMLWAQNQTKYGERVERSIEFLPLRFFRFTSDCCRIQFYCVCMCVCV